jgi:hypothetical protein
MPINTTFLQKCFGVAWFFVFWVLAPMKFFGPSATDASCAWPSIVTMPTCAVVTRVASGFLQEKMHQLGVNNHEPELRI